MSARRFLPLCAAILLGGFGLRPTRAWLAGPTDWPVERMLVNVGRYVASHPDAAEAHYCLGRIHAYAFVYEAASLAVHQKLGEGLEAALEAGTLTLDELAQAVVGTRYQQRQPPSLRNQPAKLLDHLDQAVRALRRALELDPGNGAYHLTFAYALERGAHLAAQLDNSRLFGNDDYEVPPRRVADLGRPETAEAALAELSDPRRLAAVFFHLDRQRASPNALLQRNLARLLERWWLDQAVDQYRKAFELCIDADREEELVHDYWGLVSLEAGEAYLRLTERERERFPDADDFRARVATELEKLRELPLVSAVTPIVVSVEGCRTLDELLAREHAVLFDVDGDLVEEPWPWLRPDAGWLVWDPKRTGRITNGRRLFGSASGWFFFPDGYRVLDALDDDGNGELRGAELAGIAVWFDRDSDGVSDGGEVVAVEPLGIVALATEPTERVGASLGNPCGLELADGRWLPTYDWVIERSP